MDQLIVGFMTIIEPMNFLAVFVGVLGGMILGRNSRSAKQK